MAMKSNNKIHHFDPSYLQFSVYRAEEIKKISVARIVKFETYNDLGNAIPGGVYDLAMGPSCYDDDLCATCMNAINNCAGHIGHIELCMLCYNPLLIKTVYSILRITCLNCFKLQISDHAKYIYELQIKMINFGYLELAQDLEILKSQSVYNSQMNADDSEMSHPKVAECLEILKTTPIWLNTDQNKNSESLKESIIKETIKDAISLKCIHCKEQMKRVKYTFKKLLIGITKNEVKEFYNDKSEEVDKQNPKATNISILANQCRDYLRKIFDSNKEFFTLTFPILNIEQQENVSPVDIFFTDVILVTPPRVRPATIVNERKKEHSLSTIYRNIIEANLALRMVMSVTKISDTDLNTDDQTIAKEIYDSVEGNTSYEKYFNSWQKLQSLVDVLLEGTEIGYDKRKIAGLKQIIEKKDGIIRMHMMGKRVNYAARTVIIPDPNINVDEIGIPEIFAKKLTYPVPVTSWNVAELRQLVQNGPAVHPGANLIEDENGNIKLIPADDESRRETLSKMLLIPLDRGIKIVHRHLINGDVLLLNRQPTLHRPSMMTHKARILKKEKTFRLHYSNCKSYNADFDGDEMNAHFLQNEVARSEGYNLSNVANQYLVPKDGSPLGGLIQDHIISGVRLAIRGKFFNREDYHQLVFQGLYHMRGHIQLLPPSIIKPKKLWSGKQILSTIIINLIPKNLERINLTSTTNIDANNWINNEPRTWKAGGSLLSENKMSEAEVIIRNGELLVGILDKKHYGSTPYGLIHCMHEIYGGNCSTNALTAFARLFTNFLQCEGFSLGVKDILTVPEADRKRRKIIKSSRKSGNGIVASSLDLPEDTPIDILATKMEEEYQNNPNYRKILDRKYKSSLNIYTNKINKSCVPNGLICKFPENNLQLMVQSGAKGSKVNTMQISCLLGQIELEGKRPPLMISGKTLPSFATFETSPKSGGFIDGRFMTGIQPQDFFFHCMAGREGLIDTAVKTSRSGYLQRCLVKHLEGLSVHYDMTVRDSDRSVIQFLYGEDGLDITKSQFCKLKQLQFLDENCKALLQPKILEQLKNENEETGFDNKIHQHQKKLKLYCKKNGTPLFKNRASSFQQFSINNKDVNVKKPTKICKNSGRTRITKKLIEIWENTDLDAKEIYSKKIRKCVNPSISKYRPDIHFGAVSEYMQGLIDSYLKDKPHRKLEFSDMMKLKYMMALAAPGEPVGILAAQSVGEPSTQMTLNTFHFAGRGEMNVTLGIPRLREILMLASKNIKTPSMDIPFLPHTDMKKRAEKLRRKLNRVTVAEVLESINVKSSLIVAKKRVREYVVKFNFLPHDSYKEDYCVKPKQIIKHMSQNFFPLLFKSIIKSSIEKYSIIESQDDDKITKTKKTNTDDDEIDAQAADEGNRADDSSDDEEMGDDDDATDSKFKKRQGDECDYDEPDEKEENEINDDDDDENVLENNFDGETQKDDDVLDILKSNDLAEDYRYDKVNYLWCELVFHLSMKYKNIDVSTILREAAKKSIIWETKLIKRAITYNANENIILKTEGINIVEMFKYNKILNLNRLYTNDIHAVAQTYGIEAATRVVVKEVQNVFKVYGITVDPRHLMLIADYMTYDGTFRPLSRMGMEFSTSPLQQMSFESALPFLKKAVIKSKIDDLNSPTSCLMVGLPCKSGTGSFSLINDNRGFHKKII